MSTRTVDDILATFQKAERYEQTNPRRADDMVANAYQRLRHQLAKDLGEEEAEPEIERVWRQACAAYDARTTQQLSA